MLSFQRVTRKARLCAAILLAPLPALATNGYFSNSFGTAQTALGGAGTAMVEDTGILVINPAGGVWLKDRFDVSISGFLPQRYYDASDRGSAAGPGIVSIGPGGEHSGNPLFLIPGFAYVHAIDEYSSWGVSMYGNGGLNTRYVGNTATFAKGIPGAEVTCDGTYGGGRALAGTDPMGFCGNGTARAGVDLTQLFLAPNYSYKIGSRVSVGVAPLFSVQRFSASGLAAFRKFSNDASTVSDRDFTYSYGVGGRIGVLANVIDGVGIGASYESRVRSTKFHKYTGLFADEGHFDIPSTWNVGLQLHPTTNNRFVVDFQRIYYSDVKSVSQRFDPNDFVNNCALPRLFGNMADSPSCLGGAKGPGFGWRDVSVFKFGYQYKLGDLKLRAGYAFMPKQPIASDQALFNVLAPGVIKRHYSAGIGYAMSSHLSLDFSFMYADGPAVAGKNPLSNVDPQVLQVLGGQASPSVLVNAFGPDAQDQTLTFRLREIQGTLGFSYLF